MSEEKSNLLAAALLAAIGLTLGNFIWQMITGFEQWAVAAERSYFQAFALITFALSRRRR